MHTHKRSRLYLCDIHILTITIWTVGILAGIYVGVLLGDSLSSAIRNSCFRGGAIFVPSAILPITLIFIVRRYSLGGLIYPILFCKAFLDGVMLIGIAASFGSASWLMGIPVLFSDRVATVFLLFYSVRCLEERAYRFQLWYFLFLLLLIGAILIDYYLVSRYLIYIMG